MKTLIIAIIISMVLIGPAFATNETDIEKTTPIIGELL